MASTHLLTIPREVRNRILEFYVGNVWVNVDREMSAYSATKPWRIQAYTRVRGRPVKVSFELLRVCKQLREEVIAVITLATGFNLEYAIFNLPFPISNPLLPADWANSVRSVHLPLEVMFWIDQIACQMPQLECILLRAPHQPIRKFLECHRSLDHALPANGKPSYALGGDALSVFSATCSRFEMYMPKDRKFRVEMSIPYGTFTAHFKVDGQSWFLCRKGVIMHARVLEARPGQLCKVTLMATTDLMAAKAPRTPGTRLLSFSAV